MSNDHPGSTRCAQHLGGHFTGKVPLPFPKGVLATNSYVCTRSRGNSSRNGQRWRTNDYFTLIRGGLRLRIELLEEVSRIFGSHVHLSICRHNSPSHRSEGI